jgi:hypothetical protein
VFILNVIPSSPILHYIESYDAITIVSFNRKPVHLWENVDAITAMKPSASKQPSVAVDKLPDSILNPNEQEDPVVPVMLDSFSAYSSTLKMEAIFSFETSVDTQWTTRRYVAEDGTLHILGFGSRSDPWQNFCSF